MEQFKKEYLELCLKHGLYISGCCQIGVSKVKDAFALKDVYDENGNLDLCYDLEGEEALKEIVNKL